MHGTSYHPDLISSTLDGLLSLSCCFFVATLDNSAICVCRRGQHPPHCVCACVCAYVYCKEKYYLKCFARQCYAFILSVNMTTFALQGMRQNAAPCCSTPLCSGGLQCWDIRVSDASTANSGNVLSAIINMRKGCGEGVGIRLMLSHTLCFKIHIKLNLNKYIYLLDRVLFIDFHA